MRDDPVKIRYARRVERRATRRVECTGGTTWCQVIDRGDVYTAVILDGELVAKWCGECRRILERSL